MYLLICFIAKKKDILKKIPKRQQRSWTFTFTYNPSTKESEYEENNT